jgi:hypothetical protein
LTLVHSRGCHPPSKLFGDAIPPHPLHYTTATSQMQWSANEAKLPMDNVESTRRVKELAALLKKVPWTYFFTITVYETETPGIREITRAISDIAEDDEQRRGDMVDAYLPFASARIGRIRQSFAG